MLVGVMGGEGDAESRLTGRNGRRPDGLQKVAGSPKGCSGGERGGVIADDKGNNGGGNWRGVEWERETLAKPRGASGEGEAKLVAFGRGDDAKSAAGGGRDGWRSSSRIDEGAGFVGEDRTKAGGACYEGAGGSESLAERSDEDVGLAAELGAEASAGRTEGSEGMGLVDYQGSVVLGRELGKGAQGSNVAVHAEEGFRD